MRRRRIPLRSRRRSRATSSPRTRPLRDARGRGRVAALLERLAAERAPGETRELDVTPWGGAYNRVPVDATAFAHRDELFLLKHAMTLPVGAAAAEVDAARRWLDESWTLVRPWGSGGVYPNFPDPELPEPQRAYHGPNHARLARVKAAYDPDDVLRFHQSVAP